MHTGKRKRAVIYCRISHDIEGKGLGVQRQEKECRALCERKGYEVVGVFVDNDISAFNRKYRPEYERVKTLMEAGEVDVLVAWANDRITRHPIELEELMIILEGRKIDVNTVSTGDMDLGTPGGRLMARQLGSYARMESEVKSARILSRYRQKRENGEPSGGQAPYGFVRGDRTYLIHPEHAAHIRWMVQQILANKRANVIARELNARGIPGPTGKPWTWTAVQRTVTNPAIAGLRSYQPEDAKRYRGEREIVGKGNWEAIIDLETFESVAVVLHGRKATRQPSAQYPLTGILFGEDLVGLAGQKDDKGGKANPNRRTYASLTCSIEATGTEMFLFALALDRLELDTYADDADPTEDVEQRIAEINEEREVFLDMKAKKQMSIKEFAKVWAPLDVELQELLRKREETQESGEHALKTPAELREQWAEEDERRAATGEDLTPEQSQERHDVVEKALGPVTVLRTGRNRWKPLEERLVVPRLEAEAEQPLDAAVGQ